MPAATKQKVKGVTLSLLISSVVTPIAQLLSLTPPKTKPITFESPTLDQDDTEKGIPRELSGYTDSTGFEAEIYVSLDNAAHKAVYDKAVLAEAKLDWTIVCADLAASTFTFTTPGIEVGVSLPMKDGIKMKISSDIDGAVVLEVT